jgi:hypothetical protein
MNQQSGPSSPLVLSYLALRMSVGIIGVSLPFAVAFGKALFEGPGLQRSISAYYYTDTRNILVGSLCAIGVFLFSTRGYDSCDEIAGRLAAIFAIGVAFFPTTPSPDPTHCQKIVGGLHWGFAAALFLTLAYLSIFRFTKTDKANPTKQKRQRNVVYRVSGYTIIACIGLIAIVQLTPLGEMIKPLSPVFWLEAIAIEAFGFSWLTKGEAILKDA